MSDAISEGYAVQIQHQKKRGGEAACGWVRGRGCDVWLA